MSLSFESREGTAADLQTGDFVDTVGGPGFKRYRIERSVERIDLSSQSKISIRFSVLGEFTLSSNYPVKYRRPIA